MRFIIFVLSLLISMPILACNSDYECGYGNRCVKPSGAWGMSGTCITVTDQYGNKDYNSNSNWGSSYGAKEVDSCQWNTECPIGFKCLKESGQLYGLCVK